ncbi:MAG: cytochrome c [Ottowia sp.]|nr:cytochrome c [Ottowia sp.]
MGQRSGKGEGSGVIDSFAAVQRSCLACHEAYRPDFVWRFCGSSWRGAKSGQAAAGAAAG